MHTTSGPRFEPYAGINVPSFLLAKGVPAATDEAVEVLACYTQPVVSGGGLFEGGSWDHFDPEGRRAEDSCRITSDDVLSMTLLSVRPPMESVSRLLLDPAVRDQVSHLLVRIGEDYDLVDAPPELPGQSWDAARDLWHLLRGLNGMGATKTSKLMARKRPAMFPVWDRAINMYVREGHGSAGWWDSLRAALAMHDKALHRTLIEIRGGASADGMSAIRVFDALAWMEAIGRRKISASSEVDADADAEHGITSRS